MILSKIERMAQIILNELSIHQPPICVDTIARRLGLHVIHEHFKSSDISGMLYLDKDTDTYVIGINSVHGEHRRRFTIAHHIGHFLLHPHQKIRFNRGPFTLKRYSTHDLANSVFIREQKEAYAFANALLMPGLFIDQTMQVVAPNGLTVSEESMTQLQELSKIFQVPPQSLGIRMGTLGYI